MSPSATGKFQKMCEIRGIVGEIFYSDTTCLTMLIDLLVVGTADLNPRSS
jgi:hypothetical protein